MSCNSSGIPRSAHICKEMRDYLYSLRNVCRPVCSESKHSPLIWWCPWKRLSFRKDYFLIPPRQSMHSTDMVNPRESNVDKYFNLVERNP